MQGLQTIIANLTILLFFGFFMELLLPNNSFKGYLKVILGLFIIITLLTPVLNLLHQQIDIRLVFEAEGSESKLGSIIQQSKELEKKQEEAALEMTKAHLEDQIEGMLSFTYGIIAPKVALTLEGKSLKEQEVCQVTIIINELQQNLSFKKVEPVEEVTVNQRNLLVGQEVRTGGNALSSNLIAQIRLGVGAYLNVEPEKINILIENP
ncbi:MAG: stage III sporulation protein AF [Bacillota bacterium]